MSFFCVEGMIARNFWPIMTALVSALTKDLLHLWQQALLALTLVKRNQTLKCLVLSFP